MLAQPAKIPVVFGDVVTCSSSVHFGRWRSARPSCLSYPRCVRAGTTGEGMRSTCRPAIDHAAASLGGAVLSSVNGGVPLRNGI